MVSEKQHKMDILQRTQRICRGNHYDAGRLHVCILSGIPEGAIANQRMHGAGCPKCHDCAHCHEESIRQDHKLDGWCINQSPEAAHLP